jgi:hypothetical protein
MEDWFGIVEVDWTPLNIECKPLNIDWKLMQIDWTPLSVKWKNEQNEHLKKVTERHT